MFCQNHLSAYGFQHTAARRRLDRDNLNRLEPYGFNTQPPEGGWVLKKTICRIVLWFQHTAARRRLGVEALGLQQKECFNTQPPEGGWPVVSLSFFPFCGFNTQPPEGGWQS